MAPSNPIRWDFPRDRRNYHTAGKALPGRRKRRFDLLIPTTRAMVREINLGWHR
jgi:hypothetical protein